ncbi:MAG: methionyl-tRNA formyltransferase, partial [Gammaproteobacteria bacterium]|nr:methionyl-tRNA formyltransferase [Gammaproteobacteria bacterium]
MNKPLRLIYAGTPDFSVPALRALHGAGHTIVAVLTQPDRPAGRGRKLQASPVKQAALALGLEVLQPLSLRKAAIKKQLRRLQADAMIVAAYGLILPQSVLDIPRLGCLNIHASLLPRWRGAAPIQRAIEAGDKQSGITIMQMDAGLDTGDILSMHPVPISPNETSQSLHDTLASLGAEAIVGTLNKRAHDKLAPQTQDDALATYAKKLNKAEALINWNDSAASIERKVRAFDPWPCAYTLHNNQNLRVWKAQVQEIQKQVAKNYIPGEVIASTHAGIDVQTGAGVLRLLEVQESGRKRMPVSAFINAHDLNAQ